MNRRRLRRRVRVQVRRETRRDAPCRSGAVRVAWNVSSLSLPTWTCCCSRGYEPRRTSATRGVRIAHGRDRKARLGHRRGLHPGWQQRPRAAMTSHETACILNTSDQDALVEITLYFKDRDPAGPYRLAVQPRRTLHQRFNELEGPEPVPRGKEYSSVIRSSVPVVVQHTRLDSRQAQNALLSTVAYPVG